MERTELAGEEIISSWFSMLLLYACMWERPRQVDVDEANSSSKVVLASLYCALQCRNNETWKRIFLFMVFAGSTSRRCLTHVSVEKHNFTLQCMLCIESAASERENQMIIWCFNVENLCSQWGKLSRNFHSHRTPKTTKMPRHSIWREITVCIFRHISLLLIFLIVTAAHREETTSEDERGLMTTIDETWKCFLSNKS